MTTLTGIDGLLPMVAGLPAGRRLIALAGAPASGKSRLAQELADRLTEAGRAAQVVPMDGFHLANPILQARGLLHRKGAPESFDLDGFKRLLGALRAGGEVVFPTFDRALDTAIAGAGVVAADCDCVVVEGNYLLLDEPGWRDLAGFWDLSVRLEVPRDVLLARLLDRWRDHGLDPAAARTRAEGNDMANADRMVAHALPPDIILKPADRP
ncbi:nucleoside/nucleotide kinase family protein [Actibacterium ureilyticum]|uniref:nucleoside/nucleotide kinase family protein n=1 Tax=Actibacterium ureilyticum TaxID=1590614 RepID=UPI000BAAB357|nr:nucleoside/nucleotide kinase family protein [Actibacterium ureilyticum]